MTAALSLEGSAGLLLAAFVFAVIPGPGVAVAAN
jgi:hypothetical protein